MLGASLCLHWWRLCSETHSWGSLLCAPCTELLVEFPIWTGWNDHSKKSFIVCSPRWIFHFYFLQKEHPRSSPELPYGIIEECPLLNHSKSSVFEVLLFQNLGSDENQEHQGFLHFFVGDPELNLPLSLLFIVQKSQTTTWTWNMYKTLQIMGKLPPSTGARRISEPSTVLLLVKYTPWKLTYPLKMNGWKMKLHFKMVPCQLTFVHFQGSNIYI